MWLFFTLGAMILWGLEDVLLKVSAGKEDPNFYLKLSVCMGVITVPFMLVCSRYTESGLSLQALILSDVSVLLALFIYTAAMVISYLGAMYMDISVFTPIANSSSGFAIIMILAYVVVTGDYSEVSDFISPVSVGGMVLTVAGVVSLAVLQKRLSRQAIALDPENKKYRYGVLALLFPLGFCLIDAVSTLIDSVNLGAAGETVIGVWDYLRVYGAAFILVAVFSWLAILLRTRKPYNPFHKRDLVYFGVELCEIVAAMIYMLALDQNAVLSVPIATSYCIVTLILSRVFLKEKLKLSQYICIALVVSGILLISFVGL